MKIKVKNALAWFKNCLLSGSLQRLISKYIEDICILSGLYFIIKATFLLSKIGGLYALGACLLIIGIWFIRNPAKRG